MKANTDQSTDRPIRVIIVDDDPFVRSSLSTILNAQDNIETCGEGSNGNEAIALFDQCHPDILLIDVQMPEKNGLEAAQEILDQHPQARIVFLTTFADDEYIIAALRMGAKGYLIKQEVANIALALHSIMNGHNVLGNEVLERVDTLMKSVLDTERPKTADFARLKERGLSDRELEILELVAQGLNNKEIAAEAYMSEGTVRNHISTILQKLDLKNRTQLAVLYYRTLT